MNTFSIILLLKYYILSLNGEERHNNIGCKNKTEQYLFLQNDVFKNSNNTKLTFFANFDNFNDLEMDCNQTYNTTSFIQLNPNRELVIDKSLNLRNQLYSENVMSLITVVFSNVKGYDFNSKRRKYYISNLVILFSRLDFYFNSKILNECTAKVYDSVTTHHMLQSFITIYFRQVIYPHSICPLAFSGTVFDSMYFTDITNSLLAKNKLNFVQLNNSSFEIKTLNAAYFELSYECLSLSLLNKNVFKNIRILVVIGILNSIKDDLFVEFSRLKLIQLKINNLKVFFHNENKWMTTLNKNVKVNLNNIKDVQKRIHANEIIILSIISSKNFQSFLNVYDYPEKDLCLFKYFPHEHLVFPLIFPELELKCTCTLKWLHLYLSELLKSNKKIQDSSDFYPVSNEENLTNVYHYCQKEFFKMICDFENKFQKCNLTSLKRESYLGINNDLDLFYLIKWFEFILILIVQPILCFLSILCNALVIIVLKNKKNHKELKVKMYTYVQINAFFNLLYSVIMSTKLINTCIFFYSNSTFCSKIYQSKSSQNYKIIGIYFLGNVLKNCSNISYIFFSMSRYISVSLEKKKKIFVKFNNINVKLFFFLNLLFSSVLSVFILFQYEINEYKDYRKEFPYEKRNEKVCLDKSNYFTCKLFNSFKIANQILNGVVFLILILVIDILLIRDYGKEMSTKSRLDLNKEKREEFKLKTKKITKMVLLNSIFIFISHVPVLSSTLILIIFSKKLVKFCNERLSCDLINEEMEVFMHISMISNFFILKYFNRNFNVSFQEIKKKIFRLKLA